MAENSPQDSSLAPPSGVRVIGAADVVEQIESHREGAQDAVRTAYLAHEDGATANPHSSFLRFPDRPKDRIIALPAFLDDAGTPRSGIKWIASYPGNVEHGFPRASAVMVLNDYDTGYPQAMLEASVVSATRTAASATLSAEALLGERKAGRVGFVGTGVISDHVRMFLRDLDWTVDEFVLFDTVRDNADRFATRLAEDGQAERVTVADDVADVFAGTDLVVVATVAGEPHLTDPALLADAPVVLHLSLRDFAPELVLAATNVTDDVDHAVRERTSLHLAEKQVGHRDFVDGTIADVVRGHVGREPGKAVIVSPFGLGVLDLAVGGWVCDRVCANDGGTVVPDFFAVSPRGAGKAGQ